MLFDDIPFGAMPVIDVGDDEALLVEGEFAPTGDGNAGLPREGSVPTEGPVGANLGGSLLLEVVYVHLAVAEPGLNEADHLPIAIATAKGGHRVFEVHIFSVESVGLVGGKAIVIGFKRGQKIHELGNWASTSRIP